MPRSLLIAELALPLFAFVLIFPAEASAQKLPEQPGHDRFQAAQKQRSTFGRHGRIRKVTWARDFNRVTLDIDGEKRTFDFESRTFGEEAQFEAYQPPESPSRRRSPVPRAEQRKIEPSNSGDWAAHYRDFNVVLRETANAENEIQITRDGNEKLRYGTCCWVYGEELDQSTAMWWSPDDAFLAFYEVSESHMRDYHLTIDNTESYTRLHTVRYPKAGDPNPKVAILIYERQTGKTVRAEIEGEPTQYLYGVRWTPAGDELLVNRTNRHQDRLDVLAVDPRTGTSRVVLSEQQETWQNNSPEMTFLKDGNRFIWETEKNGWKNYELRDLSGKLLHELTRAENYPVQRIVELDEDQGWLYYSASSADNPYNLQLHRVRLDGTENRRISTSPLNHTSQHISPDHRWVVAVAEDLTTPPEVLIYSTDGQLLGQHVSPVPEEEKKYLTSELFDFLADDGQTKIYGTLHKPVDFDPAKTYPLVVSVYGGPGSPGITNRFQPLDPYCEFDVCIARIGNRGTIYRGKAFESATYLKLGGPDLKDQADGVRYLAKRPYIDGSRVGIFGHSYGGYMSALALLKYPEVFHVGVAGAPVTHWANYDTIYTERYMRTPRENPDGYQQGACQEFAENLKGKLLLVHGLIDDNVHPSNTWQLAEALHQADKRFDMQIYPKFKHGIGSTYYSLRWEYLLQHLNVDSD